MVDRRRSARWSAPWPGVRHAAAELPFGSDFAARGAAVPDPLRRPADCVCIWIFRAAISVDREKLLPRTGPIGPVVTSAPTLRDFGFRNGSRRYRRGELVSRPSAAGGCERVGRRCQGSPSSRLQLRVGLHHYVEERLADLPTAGVVRRPSADIATPSHWRRKRRRNPLV